MLKLLALSATILFTHFLFSLLVDKPRYEGSIYEAHLVNVEPYVQDMAETLQDRLNTYPDRLAGHDLRQLADNPWLTQAFIIDCNGDVAVSLDSNYTGSNLLSADSVVLNEPGLHLSPELYSRVSATGVDASREIGGNSKLFLMPLPCLGIPGNSLFSHSVLYLMFDWSSSIEESMAIVEDIQRGERLKWLAILLVTLMLAGGAIVPRLLRLNNAMTQSTENNLKFYESEDRDEIDLLGKSYDNMLSRIREQLKLQGHEISKHAAGHAAFVQSDAAICIFSPDQKLVELNPAYEELNGFSKAEMLGRTLRSLVPTEFHGDAQSELLDDELIEGFSEETWGHNKHGIRFRKSIRLSSLKNASGNVEFYFSIERDVTLEHDQRAKLDLLAKTDPLTGIYNRRRFEADLNELLDQGWLNFAIGVINLDSIKEINAEYGKHAGDSLIIESGRRLLLAVTGTSRRVYRFEGDEFYVLFFNADSEADLERSARAIMSSLTGDVVLSDTEVEITASMGLALHDKSRGDNPVQTLNEADLALRHAKGKGRSQISLASSYVLAAERRKLSLSLALKSSKLTEYLSINYSPRIDVQNGILAGAEALISWQFPQLGYVSKEELYSVAAKTGDVSRIDDWAIDRALKDTLKFAENASGFQATIKISAEQALRKSFSQNLVKRLLEMRLPRDSLAIELTAQTIDENKEQIIPIIEVLKKEGIGLHVRLSEGTRLSISDRQMKLVDAIKLDDSFLGERVNSSAIGSIVKIAHPRGIPVIAEGVASSSQLALLRELGCSFCLGYLFADPITLSPEVKAENVLRAWTESIESVSNL